MQNLNELIKEIENNEIIQQIKIEAVNMNLPIILDDMRNFLIKNIMENNISSVLEIGTANGYSASVIAKTMQNRACFAFKEQNGVEQTKSRTKNTVKQEPFLNSENNNNLEKDFELITLEKDEARHEIAKQNLKNFNFIDCILGDAMEFLQQETERKQQSFDLIFLDGPKAQYKNYLPFIIKLLNNGGLLIADNINLKANIKAETKQTIKMREKLLTFVDMVKTSKELTNIELIDKADGILIARKK
jgi:predicted O-methyltransferase YrrM